MRLYNTLSQSIEPFIPRRKSVSLYTCGITPYDTTHLGHAFTYAVSDILIRYLELQGLKVRYVQNVTDIDDDILRKAKLAGEDWTTIGNRWTAHFIHDMQSLNVRPPDYYPRATDVIPDIVRFVRNLISNGVAYESGGSIYFDIHSWPEFGKLNRLPYEEMLPMANQRGNFPNDKNKRDPLDFVLWQAQVLGEPAWDSPWGPGRPGWHIECSTMSTNLLGKTVDIHSGGGDLCFPHHECEIAQVEPLTGKPPFVRFWMHVAMVRYQGEKMSKSLGNLIWVRDLLKTYTPDAIRLYLCGYHYRDSWEYEEGRLIEAENMVAKINQALKITGGNERLIDPKGAWASFTVAMDNDLDTPAARDILSALADKVNEGIATGRSVITAQQAIRQMGNVFGLQFDHKEPEKCVIDGWNKHLKRFE